MKQLALFFVTLLGCGFVAEETGTITLRFVDEDGKPVADVRNTITADDYPKETGLRSDRNGECVLDFSTIKSTNRSFQIYTYHPDYVDFRCSFSRTFGIHPTPDEYTFRMERAREVGGVVLDEKGKPVENADVEVYYLDGEPDSHEKPYWYAALNRKATTTKEGRWSMGGIPRKSFHPLGIRVKASGFRPETTKIESEDEAFEKLLKKELPRTMLPGITVRGKLSTPEGEPFEASLDGMTFHLRGPYHSLTKIPVSASGEFTFPDLVPGDFHLQIVPKDYGPIVQKLTVSEETASPEIPLRKTRPIRFRVVDLENKPLSGASLYLVVCCDRPDMGMNAKLYDLDKILPKTGPDGLLVWENAFDEAVDYYFGRSGYLTRAVRLATPREEEYTVTMCPRRTVSGTVVDAETRATPSRYWLYAEGWMETRIGGEVYKEWIAHGGGFPHFVDKDFSIKIYGYFDRCRVVVYAEGYKQIVTDEFSPKDGDRVFHFELEKYTPEEIEEWKRKREKEK